MIAIKVVVQVPDGPTCGLGSNSGCKHCFDAEDAPFCAIYLVDLEMDDNQDDCYKLTKCLAACAAAEKEKEI